MLLGVFKYTDFVLTNLNLLTAFFNLPPLPLPHFLLPLALSFVTFQQISFLYDCYKKARGEEIEVNLDFTDYCLFITFFPQLIAGPIVHHREMMPQFAALNPAKETATTNLAAKGVVDYELFAKGIFIFCVGLFKKVVIADWFAKWADAGFAAASKGGLNALEAWASSLSYTFQLYFDFSGYCDMAVGLALMFGIWLPINFNSPYKSRNIAEFWQRWHITLGRFLKNCLYIPLGGSRGKTAKNGDNAQPQSRTKTRLLTLRNLFIVFFLSGVWHGAGWGFVIWGLLHAFGVMTHRVFGWFVEGLKRTCGGKEEAQNLQKPNLVLTFLQSRAWQVLAWFLTFNFVNVAWVFFRASSVQEALSVLKAMFGFGLALPEATHFVPKLLAHIGARNDLVFALIVALLLCVLAPNSNELVKNFSSNAFKALVSFKLFGKRFCLRLGGVGVRFFASLTLFYIGVWILVTRLVENNTYSPFIYFNF